MLVCEWISKYKLIAIEFWLFLLLPVRSYYRLYIISSLHEWALIFKGEKFHLILFFWHFFLTFVSEFRVFEDTSKWVCAVIRSQSQKHFSGWKCWCRPTWQLLRTLNFQDVTTSRLQFSLWINGRCRMTRIYQRNFEKSNNKKTQTCENAIFLLTYRIRLTVAVQFHFMHKYSPTKIE